LRTHFCSFDEKVTNKQILHCVTFLFKRVEQFEFHSANSKAVKRGKFNWNMTVSGKWDPNNGFGDARQAAYRAKLLECKDGNESFPYGRQEFLSAAFAKAKEYFPSFVCSDYPIKNRFFPMNLKGIRIFGQEILPEAEKEDEATFAELIMGNETFALRCQEFFVTQNCQIGLMETPILYLLFLAGESPKFVSTAAVIRLYWTIICMIEANDLPIHPDERVMAKALQIRNQEFEETSLFCLTKLQSTPEFQSLLKEEDEKAKSNLSMFLLQYTIRTIQVMERFLIRIFDGRFTDQNSILLSSGKIQTTHSTEEVKVLQELCESWVNCYEVAFGSEEPYSLENPEPLGFLPSRKPLKDKLETSSEPCLDYSVYVLWFAYAYQYIRLEYGEWHEESE
jgi:hypothetical protein